MKHRAERRRRKYSKEEIERYVWRATSILGVEKV